jgi:hypothetical protein
MAPTCVCQDSADYIDEIYRSGAIRGLRFRLDRIHIQSASATSAKAIVTYDLSAYDELSPDGAVRDRIPAYLDAVDAISLTRTRGKWLVDSVSLVKQGA